ncbi:tRNA threonylcarbamoyladenosine dehydratase [Sulfuricurvum sp. RIFCSPLOWO2_12_FULL_43_24]|uniref:tRNA threonylcarbamoyladenosine dehydratase n=1 Tax=Sulfuricurvum sp. RIFCSPLOWO2_12_FULL_43_24 TaxID=1802247 RepID=UPI0008B0751A|nr:tRNA threonylcarbamoyladenosine dehydratase [Sulfuricurvum sp. RIFCSPLOWO2_12_FULL_43_24]OHD90193.1 MAG: tRNA cyclic N6-threonylcarbamoyladenosine(37) synthase TcdA [Sulfuricurvum sp. RIFCSPLOWO2_12_FULL_43_24]
MRHTRTKLVFGEETHAKLQNANILLLGVGGVGSFCLDCLYRSGVRHITIVDFDRYDVTNQNRQMHSENHEGELKVEALKTHYPEVIAISDKITPEWVEAFDFSSFDLILDAIDDMRAKLALIQKCYPKLISSVGSAKRLDPTKIEVRSIWKTEGDPFASKLRNELRKRKFKGDFSCICSSELPRIKEKGSFVAVTGSFGLAMCSLALRRIGY